MEFMEFVYSKSAVWILWYPVINFLGFYSHILKSTYLSEWAQGNTWFNCLKPNLSFLPETETTTKHMAVNKSNYCHQVKTSLFRPVSCFCCPVINNLWDQQKADGHIRAHLHDKKWTRNTWPQIRDSDDFISIVDHWTQFRQLQSKKTWAQSKPGLRGMWNVLLKYKIKRAHIRRKINGNKEDEQKRRAYT